MEQGIEQRKTNIFIVSIIYNVKYTLYNTQLKDTLTETLNSEVKWKNDFQNYGIVWEVAY